MALGKNTIPGERYRLPILRQPVGVNIAQSFTNPRKPPGKNRSENSPPTTRPLQNLGNQPPPPAKHRHKPINRINPPQPGPPIQNQRRRHQRRRPTDNGPSNKAKSSSRPSLLSPAPQTPRSARPTSNAAPTCHTPPPRGTFRLISALDGPPSSPSTKATPPLKPFAKPEPVMSSRPATPKALWKPSRCSSTITTFASPMAAPPAPTPNPPSVSKIYWPASWRSSNASTPR